MSRRLALIVLMSALPPIQVSRGQVLNQVKPVPGQVTPLISAVFGKYQVNVTTPQEPSFSGDLATLFSKGIPSPANRLTPYFVLATNRGSMPIVRIVVRYVTNNIRGQAMFGNNSVNLGVGGNRVGLLPGESVLVTPIGLVTQSLFGDRGGGVPQIRPPEAAAANENQLSVAVNQFGPTLQVWQANGVVVMVDSITFSTGGVIGPDSYNVIDEADSQRRATLEIADRLANSGVSDKALADWLNAEVRLRSTNPSRPDGTVDHYGFRMRALATSTLQNLKTMHRDQLSRSLRAFAESPDKLRLYRMATN